ncbi:diguanylate cyclase [Ectobacillus polymachus]|uniref:histidine kinase N-terminal 7TM domain-containing diguanylate cyclase n=1 Tax=Ectobacillus polymachus TaxID=1508806 RepID=UPI003A87F71E
MSLYIWFDFFLFILLFTLFVYVFTTVTITKLHKVYFLFHFFMMLWPLCQFATDITNDWWLQLYYVKMSFVSLSLLGGGWLLLTVFLTGNADKLGEKRLLLLFVPAIIAATGIIMNPFHSFIHPMEGGYIHRTYGPWFWFMIIILLSYFFTSLTFLFQALHSPKTSLTMKRRVKVTLWGIFVLAFFALLDLLFNVGLRNWLPIIPGLTSAGIFLSDLFFVFAIKRYNVFELVTIAHEDVINTIPYGILVLDENETIIEVNNAMQFFVNLSVGDHFDMEKFLEAGRIDGNGKSFLDTYNHRENTCHQIEIVVERDMTNYFIIQASPIVISGRNQIGRTITFQDVTQMRYLVKEINQQNEILQEQNDSLVSIRDELSKANQKLTEMALTDNLTKCYNRHYLTQQLTHEVMMNIQYKTSFSLILLDVDFFKAINDRYGHVVGDEVLYQIAQTIKQSIRSTDILARYGGEEFIIYLPHTNGQLAKQLAERLRLSVNSNPIIVEKGIAPLSITISIGVLAIEDFDHDYIPDNPEKHVIQLFATVDKALYQAKQNGRNRIEFAYIKENHKKNQFC